MMIDVFVANKRRFGCEVSQYPEVSVRKTLRRLLLEQRTGATGIPDGPGQRECLVQCFAHRHHRTWSRRMTRAAAGFESKPQVATYWGECSIPRDGHEFATLEALAREIAALKSVRYVGLFDPRCHRRPVYLVPRDTLCADEAARLNAAAVADLFGGSVRHPHVATKVITHPLVRAGAEAPPGWSVEFPRRVGDDVLYGYSAFKHDDALEAASKVLARGRARLKPAHGIGGRGQRVVASREEARTALRDYDAASLASGLVIEQDLSDVETLSVGQVLLDDMCVTYFGTQCQTTDHRGENVYGGSELTLVRGGFDALLGLDLDARTAHGIRQAMRYDAAAQDLFEGFVASRRNYDVVIGRDANGLERSGVLEQSWRAGGASPAELLAIKTFKLRPGSKLLCTATIETYGETHIPADATVIYRGEDPRVGSLTKYCTVRSHGILHRAA